MRKMLCEEAMRLAALTSMGGNCLKAHQVCRQHSKLQKQSVMLTCLQYRAPTSFVDGNIGHCLLKAWSLQLTSGFISRSYTVLPSVLTLIFMRPLGWSASGSIADVPE